MNQLVQSLIPQNGEARRENLHNNPDDWLSRLYTPAYWLQPFLPCTAGSIMELLDGTDIRMGEALFPRQVEEALFPEQVDLLFGP